MNLMRWRMVATLTALTLCAGPASVAALPAIATEHTETHEAAKVKREANPPLTEPDLESLRTWMSQSLRPVLLDDGDIDPGQWPLLEFRPFSRGLELELDLPALLDPQH